MATITLTIFKAKVLKDGRHKIRVAVRHKHVTCYIITPYIIDNLSQWKNGQVVNRSDASIINTKLRTLMNEYQDKLNSIKGISLYDCRQVKDILADDTVGVSACTFQSVCEEYISELLKDGRENYAKLLERNCRYFSQFAGDSFLIADITPQIINNYSRFLVNKGLGETSVGMALSRTRVIINRAKKYNHIKYDIDPFSYYSIQKSTERELDLSVEDIRKIRDYKTIEKKVNVARDTFMLSYYLGGINLVDMLDVDFRNMKQIDYIRKKTRNTKRGEKRISLTIQEEAKQIIQRWMNPKTGKLDFGYKFTYDNFSRYNTRNIQKLAAILGITSSVCYYSARKSFVQHGFELGVPLEVLEYTIGQTMKANRPIFNYVKIMRKHADAAIRKILDNLSKDTCKVIPIDSAAV